MQALKSLETNFNNQSRRVKIELFLFPLIILLIFIFVSLDSKYKIDQYEINDKETLILDNINMKKNLLDIIKDIEIFIKKNKIQLKNISSTNKKITVEINTNITRQLLFLEFLENYNRFSKIDSFSQSAKSLGIVISFEKIYFKDSIDLKSRIKTLSFSNSIKYNLFAIIGNKALIDNKWIKLNDKIDAYKLIKIEKNKILLSNAFENIKLIMDEK